MDPFADKDRIDVVGSPHEHSWAFAAIITVTRQTRHELTNTVDVEQSVNVLLVCSCGALWAKPNPEITEEPPGA